MYAMVETFKGKKYLICNGYRYLCDRMRNINTYWRYENRTKCPGRLFEKTDQNPIVTALHIHEVNAAKNQQEISIAHLKQQIREQSTPSSENTSRQTHQ